MPFELSESQSAVVAQMKQSLSKMETEEGRMKGVNFKPHPDDIFIVSPPKCGTTWACQIVQSLRSGGDMSFEEINLAIPCVEMAHDYGYTDLQAEQGWHPRAFKTHFWRRDCPRGAGKYLFICRDPLDAGPSFFHFLQGWFFDPGTLSMDEFLEQFWLRRGDPPTPMQNAGQWNNMASWFPHRADPDVLWLHYEDLQADLPAAVALIARFLQLGQDDPELQALAVQQAGIEAMKQHPTKYDEHMLKAARNKACGRPAGAGLTRGSSGKVRLGGPGGNREQLSPELRAAILQRWTDVMLPATGYASYGEMRRGINAELGRPFAS